MNMTTTSRCVQNLPGEPIRSAIISYVNCRRCSEGGYCFYRLDEPNAGDTYHALKILSLLGEEIHDKKTAVFLRSLQRPDGSYSSYNAAFFAGHGLRLMNESPVYDPAGFISRPPGDIDSGNRPVDSFLLFSPIITRLSLFPLYHIPFQEDWKNYIIKHILGFRTRSGGFGADESTLLDTWQASESLLMLGYPCKKLGVIPFLQSCEDPEFGYLGKPDSRPAYIEHLYAGLRLNALTGTAPRFKRACLAFLNKCTHHSGGFTRSVFGGSPTLEYTAMAVKSFSILAGERINPPLLGFKGAEPFDHNHNRGKS